MVGHPGYPGNEDTNELIKILGLASLPSKEEIRAEIEDKWLTPKDSLPPAWISQYQLHWEEPIKIPSLLSLSPSPPPTKLSFVRSGLEGKVVGYVEKKRPRETANAQTSTSLLRDPAPASNFVRGKSGYLPFRPGGLDDAILTDKHAPSTSSRPGELLTIAPGLDRGIDFGASDDASQAIISDIPKTTAKSYPNNTFDPMPPMGSKPHLINSDLARQDVDDFLPAERLRIDPQVSAAAKRRTQVVKRNWAHVVDVNKGIPNFRELVPDMAHKYTFELDNFQKEAVYHLEMGDSVFVAAHTSAGKTVVAEYAIALAAKHMTRAIYTSPIKALSNQKFRDFKTTFDPSTVGILTGDVQINPEGSCLIMTTEILRSMLYKGADLIRDVEFVIFDEVHYVNDIERGVVWEEVIILLPEHVNIILLSATVPNTKEFADWVGLRRTKKKDIYVISTPKRPIPLEHFLYAGRELHKIVDAQGQFLGQGYKNAGEALKRKQDKEREAAGLPPVQRVGARGAAPPGRGGTRGVPRGRGTTIRGRGAGGMGSSGPRSHQQQDRNIWVHLVGHLRKNSLLPVVIFTFSKKRCEENAGTLSNTDLLVASEKSEVHITIEKALNRLKGSDKKLPQIARMRDLLSRGIAVHHGGLLPIVKEVVELLFARGLVKVLFATETFAMGVNMPARSVVFSGIRKHDGRGFRDLLPGEYTQMSGRAGRRGLDATGVVIIVSGDELPDTPTLHRMMLGPATKLSSQFRLTYNMILNLLRVETLKVEEMIKRSFSENASQRLLPDQQKEVLEVETQLRILPKLDNSSNSDEIRAFYDVSEKAVHHYRKILQMAASHQQGPKTLGTGRVVVLRNGHFRGNLAVLLRQDSLITAEDGLHPYWVLALVDEQSKKNPEDVEIEEIAPRWPPAIQFPPYTGFTYEVAAIAMSSVGFVTNKTIKVDVTMVLDRALISALKATCAQLELIATEWKESAYPPRVEWPRIRTLDFQEALRTQEGLIKALGTYTCVQDPSFETKYAIVHGEKVLRHRIANLRLAISDENLELLPDYEQRVDVLKELQHIDEHSTVLLKGRVACEINSTNELVLTELILENTLVNYSPEEVVALLSAFVFQEKTDIGPELSPKLQAGRDALEKIADRVGRIQDTHKVVAAEFTSSLKFGLVEAVYAWACGVPFEAITQMTDVAEGTIVRCITRLDETCREVRDAARVIGDAELFKKMEEAQILIKRDIVFAASLYF